LLNIRQMPMLLADYQMITYYIWLSTISIKNNVKSPKNLPEDRLLLSILG
jgi:hypothetical protein